MHKRKIYNIIKTRLQEPRKFIQVLAGPRQTGKTTLIQQLMPELSSPVHYASADGINTQEQIWIEQQWEIGRLRTNKNHNKAILILDEVQKVPNWPETVKKLWDQDTKNKTPLILVLLGSSPLLIHDGLTEIIPIPHWSFTEMQEAFGFSLEQYIFFGGYPGAASLITSPLRWANYICDSLIETTISRDILLMTQVKKPALLRRLFQLGCSYSGQILSFQKMLGQLQDAGNTTTLAHYLDLLSGAGLLTGLQKHGRDVHKRASSPKLHVLNTALISAQNTLDLQNAQHNRDYWGCLVESAIGAHLLNSSRGKKITVSYWREQNKEVDFILQYKNQLIAIEVKSGRKTFALSGMQEFKKIFTPKRLLLIGEQGISIKEFLQTAVEDWF